MTKGGGAVKKGIMQHEKSITSKVPNTRALAAFVLVIVYVSFPMSVRAQGSAAQPAAVQQPVNDQLRRIEALEAALAQLQQEVTALKSLAQQTAGAQTPSAEEGLEEPFDHAFDGKPPMDPDPKNPSGDLPHAKEIDSYGSLRAVIAKDTGGHTEVQNNSSRLGLRGEKELFHRITAFGRYEVGMNLVANDRAILLIDGDAGTPIGQGSQAIFTRLGFVGVGTPIGNFSWGKQWSPYYDVAEFADQLVIFSGLASGAFGAGTDGGIAGTGRSERAMLYRDAWGPVAVGVQVQNRSLTLNDRAWADAWCASAILGKRTGFAIGAAYNKVRDGVDFPTLNESARGDQAAIFGARFSSNRFYAGSIFAATKQHEIDDLGRRFNGNGFEVALRGNFTERLWLEGAYNNLQPNSDHPGDFHLRFGASNLVYSFSEASRVFFGFRLEGSRLSDGSDARKSTFAVGMNYTF
jgi:predicted porin